MTPALPVLLTTALLALQYLARRAGSESRPAGEPKQLRNIRRRPGECVQKSTGFFLGTSEGGRRMSR